MTEAVHLRFWASMGERFGKRWLDEYGNQPTKSWVELLNHYTPDDVHVALTAMGKSQWAHPPTMPQFEKLLNEAARAAANQKDWTRDYWRSVIINAVAKGMVARGLISCDADFEEFLTRHKHTLGRSMRGLLDDLDSMEKKQQQRTDGLSQTAEERCRHIVRTFTPATALEVVR